MPSQADDPYAEFLKVPQWPTRAECASCYKIESVHRGAPPAPVVNEEGVASFLDSMYCHDAEAACWHSGDGGGAAAAFEASAQRLASAIMLAAVVLLVLCACRGFFGGPKRKKEEDMV